DRHVRHFAVQGEGAPAGAAAGEVVVARYYSAALREHVQGGGRAIVLADARSNEPVDAVRLPVGHIIARERTSWQGDWATSFAWVNKTGPLAGLPGGPLLEMEYESIMPDAVIEDVPTWLLKTHSWAGLAVGWVHKAVSLLVTARYGKGQLLVTTFRLTAEPLAQDAIARTLFAGILELAQ
ncbi:MAG TPA: hypothetical protein PLC98_19380, partial [Anaerolineales bacterium]|nr:hypothetical protein [Anaerolineales bacterium]